MLDARSTHHMQSCTVVEGSCMKCGTKEGVRPHLLNKSTSPMCSCHRRQMVPLWRGIFIYCLLCIHTQSGAHMITIPC